LIFYLACSLVVPLVWWICLLIWFFVLCDYSVGFSGFCFIWLLGSLVCLSGLFGWLEGWYSGWFVSSYISCFGGLKGWFVHWCVGLFVGLVFSSFGFLVCWFNRLVFPVFVGLYLVGKFGCVGMVLLVWLIVSLVLFLVYSFVSSLFVCFRLLICSIVSVVFKK
jgi:hypothetical protein